MSITFKRYLAHIHKVKQRNAKTREKQVQQALEKISTLMERYQLTIADLVPTVLEHEPRRAPILYWDLTTGATWTGRGRPPNWLKGKNRNEYKV